MKSATDDTVDSIESFLTAVWKTVPPRGTEVRLFRGQAENKPLLPRLFRRNSVAEVKKCESKMLSEFKNESPYLFPSRPDNDWDWLSLGQHYGLATRMLDWTANPLTALFFAVEQFGARTPTVYIYPTQKKQIVSEEQKRDTKCSPFNRERTVIIQPVRHSLRIAMQAGWHTVHRIFEREHFVPLQDMKFHDGRITVVHVSPQKAKRIRDELALMGIRHATVYGDLQAVCTAIQNDLGIK
jgi:FRG domain